MYTAEEIRGHRLAFVEALESGKYPQTQNFLTKLGKDGKAIGHCCLGVACEVAIENGVRLDVRVDTRENFDLKEDFGIRVYDGVGGFLPYRVRVWLDAKSDSPPVIGPDGEDIPAVSANDIKEWSFEEIAAGFRRAWGLPERA